MYYRESYHVARASDMISSRIPSIALLQLGLQLVKVFGYIPCKTWRKSPSGRGMSDINRWGAVDYSAACIRSRTLIRCLSAVVSRRWDLSYRLQRYMAGMVKECKRKLKCGREDILIEGPALLWLGLSVSVDWVFFLSLFRTIYWT